MMEVQSCETVSPQPRVKAVFCLGSETHSVQTPANKGLLSEQLVLMKEESMTVLKDFITKHNVLNEVPDETDDISSEDDETNEKATVKSKKQRK